MDGYQIKMSASNLHNLKGVSAKLKPFFSFHIGPYTGYTVSITIITYTQV